MNFFDVQTEAIQKIYVPIRNVKTDHLKAIFSDYSNPPTLNEIKEACRKDGRPEEEISKMNLPSLPEIFWKKNKIVFVEKNTKQLEEEEFEPEWEGYDMEPTEDDPFNQ